MKRAALGLVGFLFACGPAVYDDPPCPQVPYNINYHGRQEAHSVPCPDENTGVDMTVLRSASPELLKQAENSSQLQFADGTRLNAKVESLLMSQNRYYVFAKTSGNNVFIFECRQKMSDTVRIETRKRYALGTPFIADLYVAEKSDKLTIYNGCGTIFLKN